MATDIEYLTTAFRHFAEICEGQSPLYAELSARIAREPSLMGLATGGQERQPPANLLFGAVNALLLAGTEHSLAEFYPSVGGQRAPGAEAWTAFADFCRCNESEIVRMVSTKRVQTNEVGRCGTLLPALAQVSGGQPLHLIEIGASAGLNLVLDGFHYEYTRDGQSVHTCGPDSPARLRTALRGDGRCPLPDEVPVITGRLGIDIEPVDVNDDEAVRWLEALIWPDQVRRLELFRAAVALARAAPPRLLTGDGLDLVADAVACAPAGSLPCIFHAHTIYQMTPEWRDRFDAALDELAHGRDLCRVSLEWLGDDPGPRIHLTDFRGGVATRTHVADCHHHGTWLRWLAS